MAQAKTELEPQGREQTAELRVIFETLPLGVVCLKDRRVQSANFAFDQMFGYARGATAGLDMLTFYARTEDHERIGREGYAALARGEVYRAEAQLRRADGSLFAGSLTGRAVAPQNLAAGSIWQVEDITERRRAEAALRASEGRFRTVFEQAPLGVALIDSLTGHIYEVNAKFANIVGRTRTEMTTLDWMSITHPDDVQEDQDQMARLNAGEITGFDMQKRYRRPDGSYTTRGLVCYLCFGE